MPRNGAGVYSHPFPNVVAGTTIESTVFNGNTSDVEQDLNTPRPIVAGGTGANNAHDAMIALSGEIAKQGDVRNFDTFPWVNGSFYSTSGATAGPPSGGTTVYGIAGIYYEFSDTGYATIEARDMVTHVQYIRHKSAGTWGAWLPQPGGTADLDAAYVNVTGDTMTGMLTASAAAGPGITVSGWDADGGAASLNGAIYLGNNGAFQGQVHYGTGTGLGVLHIDNTQNNPGAKVVLSVGSSGGAGTTRTATLDGSGGFTVAATATTGTYYFGNTGTKYLSYDGANYALVGGPLYVGSYGSGNFLAAGNITSAQSAITGIFNFGTSGTKYLNYDGANFILNGGNLFLQDTANPALGTLRFGNTSTKYLNYDGANFNLIGGGLNVSSNIIAAGDISSNTTANTGSFHMGSNGQHALLYDGTIYGFVGTANVGTGGNLITNFGAVAVQFGGPAATGFYSDGANVSIRGYSTGTIYFQNAGGAAIYGSMTASTFTIPGVGAKPGGGAWSDSSDARIKNVLGEYTRGLNDITALRPVYYTYKGNDTDAAPAAGKDAEGHELPVAVPYANSPHVTVAAAATKYTGLIAQEVEAIFPEMVTQKSGYIDGAAVTDLRTLDTTPLIFALVNAVKELKAEVDALKAAR